MNLSVGKRRLAAVISTLIDSTLLTASFMYAWPVWVVAILTFYVVGGLLTFGLTFVDLEENK